MPSLSKICLSDAWLHTTAPGATRIGQNLGLTHNTDVVEFYRHALAHATIVRRGKNYYATTGDVIITINANSHTIITTRKNPHYAT